MEDVCSGLFVEKFPFSPLPLWWARRPLLLSSLHLTRGAVTVGETGLFAHRLSQPSRPADSVVLEVQANALKQRPRLGKVSLAG